MKQSNSQVGFDVLKDLKKMTRKSKKNNIVDVSQIKLENKVNNKILKEYESKSVYEKAVDDKKYITKIEGNISRSRNSLENSCDVNFVGSEKLDKELKERSVIRDKGKSKLQESLFIIPVNQLLYSITVGMDQTQDRLCVPKGEIRTTLILKFHNPPSEGHFGAYRTYYALANGYYWPKMFKDVNKFVKTCMICQQTKSLTKRTHDLLQPLPIPEERWSSVSLDFITGLPPTPSGYDTIMVVVDRSTKVAHFIPTVKSVSGEVAAKLFIDNIIRIHGLPQEIISDKDSIS